MFAHAIKARLKGKGGGIKGAVCASSGVAGSDVVSEPQSKQTHIYTVKSCRQNTFMLMWVKLLIKPHSVWMFRWVKPSLLKITVELI